MNYTEIIDRLFQVQGMNQGLENALRLNSALQEPASSYQTIHVAGSNGKGSVTTKIAKALELSGYRVGIYTSPHLFSFRERISVDGIMISEEDVIEGMQRLFVIQEKATFFELTTFLAFDYFKKCRVDFAVIETGLGGRLDATNVITPLLSIITSISREHAQVLGSDLEQIAFEKAGIIKPKVPLVVGPKARFASIYNRAKEHNSPVHASKKISHFFDEENSAIAQLALEQLKINPDAIQEAIKVRPPCRFEKVGEAIFDVAHNPDAIFNLLQALHAFYPDCKFRFLVGFSKDKEYGQCLDLIADVASHIHLVQAGSPRAATVDNLREALKSEDPKLYTSHFSVEEGIQTAYEAALSSDEILVVCGSFYIMAEAKLAIQATAISK